MTFVLQVTKIIFPLVIRAEGRRTTRNELEAFERQRKQPDKKLCWD